LSAFASGAMTTAVALLEQALAGDETPDPEVATALASALARTGRLEEADSLLTTLAADAAAAGDRRGEVLALLELQTQRLQTQRVQPAGAADLAEALIREFEQDEDTAVLAKAWRLAAEAAPTWAATVEMLERALAYAQRAGDEREAADVAWWLGVCFHHAQTPVGAAIRRCEELRAIGSDRTVEAGMLGMLAGLHAMQARFDVARDLFARGLAILSELGIELRLATRRTISGEIELLAGDAVAAERELRWGYDRLLAMGERGDLPAIAAQLAQAVYEQGRLAEAEELCSFAEGFGGGTGAVRGRAVRARILADRGQLGEAVELARAAVALADPERLNVYSDTSLDLARVTLAAGLDEEAASAAARAYALYDAKENTVGARRAREVLDALQGSSAA
jgi:tetratricopeptide (TPR) repeat protein